MTQLASLEISKTVIESIMKEQIQAAIVGEMSKTSGNMVERIVSAAVNQRVNSYGNPTNDNYGSMPLMEYLLKEAIAQVSKNAVKEFINSQKDEIQKAMLRELSKSRNQIVKNFVETLITKTNDKYAFDLKIQFNDKKD